MKGVGVTVNTLTPGVIMVDGLIRFALKRYGDDTLSIEEITSRLAGEQVFELPPAGRLGTPQELALIACTLASPLSGFVTGSNYRVDGGQVRSVL